MLVYCETYPVRYKPSASEHMTKALFPPSSSETRFKLDLDESAKIRRPTWKVPAIIIQNRKWMHKSTHISMDLNWQHYWKYKYWYFVNRTERSSEIRRSNYYFQTTVLDFKTQYFNGCFLECRVTGPCNKSNGNIYKKNLRTIFWSHLFSVWIQYKMFC